MRLGVLGVGSRQIGGAASSCFVLAAVGPAHGGSTESALRMVEAAFKMGADGISFQVYQADLLVVKRHPERASLEALELTPEEWKRLLRVAKASGLALVAEVFDQPSFEVAAESGTDAFEVPGSETTNPEFVRSVAAAGKPLLLASSGLGADAVEDALELTGSGGAGLFHGSEAIPSAVEDVRFRDLEALKQRHHVPVGFRDHTDGGSAFALVAPSLAAARGADFVEKRFVLDRREKALDHPSALGPEDFYRMVEILRQAERAHGDAAMSLDPRLRSAVQGRSVVATSLIPRGEVLTATVLTYKLADPRFSLGFAPREIHRVIGRRAARPIQADEVIREDMLD